MSKLERPMNKFKVGDRVKCYFQAYIYIGTILEINDNSTIKVTIDRNSGFTVFHHKQCRLLKTKPKVKSVKINFYTFAEAWDRIAAPSGSNLPSSCYPDKAFAFTNMCEALGLKP